MKHNRFTRAIALVMTMVMALSLVACGNKAAVTPDGTAKPAVTETDKAKDNAPVADKKTAGANADKVKADANKTTADAGKAETKTDNASMPADSKSDSKNSNSSTTTPAQKPASNNQSTSKPSSNTGSSTKTEPKTPAQPSQPSKPAHTHSYTAKTVAPTCTEKGYTVHTCSCGDSYKDSYKDALGHNYSKKVVEPTTSAGGYTQYTCSRCGKSYKDNYTDPIKSTDYLTCGADVERLVAEANAYAKSIGMNVVGTPDEWGYGSTINGYFNSGWGYAELLDDITTTLKLQHECQDGILGSPNDTLVWWGYNSTGNGYYIRIGC